MTRVARRRGFTLVEISMVVVIAVLLLVVAVPAFQVITGGRSLDSAQNQLAGVLGRAWQDAVGAGDFRGVLIYTDPNTERLMAFEVYFPNPGGDTTLELVPNRDDVLLPIGVSAAMIEDKGTLTPGGVLMFDGQGQFATVNYKFAQTYSQNGVTLTSALYQRLQDVRKDTDPSDPTNPTPPLVTSDSTQFGLYLFDLEQFKARLSVNPGLIDQGWVRDNGIPLLVSRYNGTFLRGE